LPLESKETRLAKKPYTPPTVSTVGSLKELTLQTNKFTTHRPDGLVFHPGGGGPTIVETS
jgi:hypothetical protein